MKLSRFFTALGVSLCALGSIHTASAALLAGNSVYIDFGRNDVSNGVIMPSNTTMNTGAGNSTGIADSYGIYWNNAWMNFGGGGGTTPLPDQPHQLDQRRHRPRSELLRRMAVQRLQQWRPHLPEFLPFSETSPPQTPRATIISSTPQTPPARSTLTLTGLDPSLTYDFKIFATRRHHRGPHKTSRYTDQRTSTEPTSYDLQTTQALDIGAGGYERQQQHLCQPERHHPQRIRRHHHQCDKRRQHLRLHRRNAGDRCAGHPRAQHHRPRRCRWPRRPRHLPPPPRISLSHPFFWGY